MLLGLCIWYLPYAQIQELCLFWPTGWVGWANFSWAYLYAPWFSKIAAVYYWRIFYLRCLISCVPQFFTRYLDDGLAFYFLPLLKLSFNIEKKHVNTILVILSRRKQIKTKQGLSYFDIYCLAWKAIYSFLQDWLSTVLHEWSFYFFH